MALGINYKGMLERALQELSKHPDFKHISEIAAKHGAVHAAGKIGEIVASQAKLRESNKAATVDKGILESLLKALAKHPDFVEIQEMVDKQMPITAAGRVKEILAEQVALQEAVNSEVFDHQTGMWLDAKKPTDDDVFIIVPGTLGVQANELAKDDNPWFHIPESDDSGIITYGGDAAGVKEAKDDIFILNPDSYTPQSDNDFDSDNFGIIEY